MNYEKEYKEALERAKTLYENANGMILKKWVEQVFPEFKRNEDEKIRKALIHSISEQDGFLTAIDGISVKDILVWLEKQGEIDKISYEIAEKEKREFVSNGFIKCYADFQDFKEGETYWLEYLGNDDYNVRSDNLLGKTYHITPCQLYTIFKKQTWLEKKDETITEDFGEFINILSKQFPEVSFAKLSRIAVRVKKWVEKQDVLTCCQLTEVH